MAIACWEATSGAAQTQAASKTTEKEKEKAAPGKRASRKKPIVSDDHEAATPGPTLDEQFYSMIHGDDAFWIRILRYEPIAFDELISRALAAGIAARGWKDELKRFLDTRVGSCDAQYRADTAGRYILHF